MEGLARHAQVVDALEREEGGDDLECLVGRHPLPMLQCRRQNLCLLPMLALLRGASFPFLQLPPSTSTSLRCPGKASASTQEPCSTRAQAMFENVLSSCVGACIWPGWLLLDAWRSPSLLLAPWPWGRKDARCLLLTVASAEQRVPCAQRSFAPVCVGE